MGRNIKEGLSFFPLDVDFFDDEKLMFVTARFGVKGDGIVTRLLCRIYRAGYCLKYDSDFALLFARSAGDINLSGLVNDVVKELLKRGFFDEDIFKRFGLLTSKGIQERYAKICTDAKRKGWEILPEYDLLRSKCAFTPEEIPKTPEDSTQSKVKESKEEKSKDAIASVCDFDFAAFWEAYGKKTDRTKCEKAWSKLGEPDKALIMQRLPAYVASTPEIRFRKNPLTWLNGKCWKDEAGDAAAGDHTVTDPQDSSIRYHQRDYPGWHLDAPFDFGNITRYKNGYPLRNTDNVNIPGSNAVRS